MEEKSNKENNNLKRENLLQQISSQKVIYVSIFDTIISEFLNQYENNYTKLSEELKQKDENIIKYLNQGEEMDNYTKKINENLKELLENLKKYQKKFSEDFEKLCNSFNDQIWNQNLKEIDDYINQVIEEKEKQKKLEEENQKKLEEERQKKLEEEKKIQLEKEKEINTEEVKKRQLEEEKRKKLEDEKNKKIQENNKNFEKVTNKEIKTIEIDGKKNKETNIKSLLNKNNNNKLIIKAISKEDLENIFEKKNKKSGLEIKDLEEFHNILNLEGVTPNEFQRNATFSSFKNNFVINEGENENKFDSITNIVFKNSDLEKIKINELFPNLVKLKIKNSKIDFDISSKKLNLKYLQSLKLENIGLIDNNFNDLFDFIRSNEQIRNNLRIFSVKNNKISYIDYKRGYADNILSSMIFNNLEILDMSYNKLYYFQNQMFNCLENIKFIDLTDNNISYPNNIAGLIKSAKIKKCLLLITRNLGVLKDPENLEYNNYLKEILPKINYPMKKITFDNIFCDKLYENIQNLDFSHFSSSLTYIDLSNGQLKDKDMIDLFNNKLPFANLKTLILIANYLTQEFLYSLSSDDKYTMDKLKVLKLSENNIKCSDIEKFKKFLEFFKNLEMLELKCTPFESNINQYFKQKIINHHDPDNKKGFTRDLNEDETNIEKILDNNYLKEKTKLKIYILDLSGGKYTEKIYQNFPNLTEGLDIENKFPYKT